MPYSGGTGPLDSYEAQIRKEEVADLIGLISPEDTPCYTAFRKTTTDNRVYQWQEDALRSPAANRQVEGVDVVTVTAGAPGTGSLTATAGPAGGVAGLTTARSNQTQLFIETAQTSGTTENSAFYGRGNEHDYQVMKKGLELKRDIEYAFLLGQAGAAGDSSTARQLTSIDAQCGNTVDAGTGAAFTEAQVLSAHQACWEDGGEPNWLMVSPAHSLIVADFAYRVGGATPFTSVRGRDVGSGTELVNVVELYRDPFGTLQVVLNRYMGAAGAAKSSYDAYLLQTDAWWIPVLQPIETTELAKTGHNRKTMLSTELTLAHLNRDCSARIYDLSAAGT